MDAPFPNDHLVPPESVEDFAIQTFIPELLLSRFGFLAGHGNRLALTLQYLDLAQLRLDLLLRKSLACHLLSSFQFNTLISSGSENAGQVMSMKPDRLLQAHHSASSGQNSNYGKRGEAEK